jgi:hypothetical protein
MTKTDTRPSRADQIAWAMAATFMALAAYLMAMTWMIDLGAAAHDAFCTDPGVAVSH